MVLPTTVTLEVTYTKSQNAETNKFGLVVEVIRNELIPAEVFVFQRDLSGTDTFYAVAIPAHFDQLLSFLWAI